MRLDILDILDILGEAKYLQNHPCISDADQRSCSAANQIPSSTSDKFWRSMIF